MAGAPLRVQLLGPVRAWQGGQELELGPPRQRVVLALLATRVRRTVSRDELVDAVWDEPPKSAANGLHIHVSRLRQALEPARGRRAPGRVLVSSGSGYRLQVTPDQVDAGVFAGHLSAARRLRADGDLAAASQSLEAALGQWQGGPLAGLPGPWAAIERVRLAEARLAAMEERADVRLALGGHADLVAELAGLVNEHPLRERLRCQLMLALYRCDRQAEALAVFRDTRRVLVAELGIEPGSSLRRLHERMLARDPALDLVARGSAGRPRAGLPGSREPPARREAPVPRELPADVTAFTGRAAELAELDRLLGRPARRDRPAGAAAGGGAVTGGDAGAEDGAGPTAVVISALSGTAGVGKTALAVRWAHRTQRWFPDGQLYVDLRGYHPDQPLPAAEALARFLRALGVAGQDIPAETEERAARYRSLVHGKRMLVVLDNAASVAQVRPLLPGTRSVAVLVTSRDSLAGLAARDGARRMDLDLLTGGEAVALLRAIVGGRVDADPAAAAALAGQCARLPLALRVAAELAAARPAAPLAELAAELAGHQERLDRLDVAGDPHSAVRTVFSWSYRYLPAAAARMFRLLGLHPGPDWDSRAAAALAATTPGRAGARLDLLGRAHLIERTGAGRTGSPRYAMHDLLRAYAASLAAREDPEDARRTALTGLFDYYLASAAGAMDTLFPAERHRRPHPPPPTVAAPPVARPDGARAWLDAERLALVAAVARAAGHGWPSHAIRLAATLHRYLLGGHYGEALAVHGHALRAARDRGDRAAETHALTSLGVVHYRQGQYQQAARCHQRALDLARDGDPLGQARALTNIGNTRRREGDYEQAARDYQRALTLYRQIGDRTGEARALGNLGLVYFCVDRYEQSADHHQQAITLSRQIGDRTCEARTLTNLGEVCQHQGQHEQAIGYQRDALVLFREIGDRYGEAHALANLGVICDELGRYQEAATYHEQAVALYQEIGDPAGTGSPPRTLPRKR